MMVLGVQYVFLIIRMCARAHLCVRARTGILRPSGYWLRCNDEGGDGGEGEGRVSHLEFLLISPRTPTLAWLPFTHMIRRHDEGMDAFFAYSYPLVLLSRGCALS